MTDGLHVIFGTGPVGCWTAQALAARGLAVRAVNRSGARPALLPEGVEVVAADASDPSAATSAAAGASVVYQAMNPAYTKWAELFPGLQQGALAAARAAGARYVSVENLYVYDSSGVMTEESPIAPVSKKGEVRRRMSEQLVSAAARDGVPVVQLRSADYYGPGVLASALGERVFPPLLAGKKAQLSGSASLPHSFAYIEDVGRTAAELGVRGDAPGRVWFAPHAAAPTQGQLVAAICRELDREPAMTVLSPFVMRLAGLFVPDAKESVEMMYEFTKPFVVDASRSERELGLQATPTEEGVRRTVAWYRARP